MERLNGCENRVQSNGDTEDCGERPTVGDSRRCVECLREQLRWTKSNAEKAIEHLKQEQLNYDRLKAALDAHEALKWDETFIRKQTYALVARWVNDRFESVIEAYRQVHKEPPVYGESDRARLTEELLPLARSTVLMMAATVAL